MTQKPKPKYWFFTVTDRHIGEEYWTAEQGFARGWVSSSGVFQQRRGIQNRLLLEKSRIYIAGRGLRMHYPNMMGNIFAGICELQSDYKEIDNHEEVERLRLGSSDPNTKRRHGVYLRNVRLFTHQVSLDEAKVRLGFLKMWKILEDVKAVRSIR